MRLKIIVVLMVLCVLATVGLAQKRSSRNPGDRRVEREPLDPGHRRVERELGVLTDPEVDKGLGQIRVEETKKEVEEWDETLKENREKKPGEDSSGFIEWRDDSGKLHEETVE